VYNYVRVLELKSKPLELYEKSNGKHLSEEDREKRNEIIKKIEEGEKQ
jgi:hypothetical protein